MLISNSLYQYDRLLQNRVPIYSQSLIYFKNLKMIDYLVIHSNNANIQFNLENMNNLIIIYEDYEMILFMQ